MNLREMEHILNHGDLRQVREAMNSTSFYQFMQKGVRGLLIGAYERALQGQTYQELTVLDPSDSNKEDYPSQGQPQLPKSKAEGMPYDILNGGSPDNVQVTNITYGGIIELNSEADADDKTPGKSLRSQASQVGPGHAKKKDKVFYSILTANGACYDANNLFSLNHPGYTGGAARGVNDNIYTNVTMSANALATALGTIAQWEGADPDQDLEIMPTRIVCPLTLEGTGYGLTRADLLPLAYAAGPYGPAAANGQMPNYLKNKLGVTSSYRLDKVSTTDWYLWTDFPGFLFQPREGVSVMAEAANSGASFENGVLRWRSSERFGMKPINWRFAMLVS